MDTAPCLLASSFFAPLDSLLPDCPSQRSCPVLSDAAWLRLGITRVLEDKPSGRAFLQELASSLERVPPRSSFFDSLASPRRLHLCQEANAGLRALLSRSIPDPLSAYPALALFDVYAGDGHFHAAAAHDLRDPAGTAYATGHLYLLNLRSHAAHHLDTGDRTMRKKEHDMRTLKRQTPEALRAGAPKGRKVILVWDRAGIDFDQWRRWKENSGIYFISRPKENMVLSKQGDLEYDSADCVNTGILADEMTSPATHMRMVRLITFRSPLNGEAWQVLTNEHTLPPGLVVKLYLMRWDIEKLFDEFKNKLMERKSWASSPSAKCMQAVFLCLTHNLMLLQEQKLESEHAITNTAEDRRRAKRLSAEKQEIVKANRVISPLREALQRCTQRSVKFIRWLRSYLFGQASWDTMLRALRLAYRHS
jgi:Transposase DDE domain